MEIVRGRSVLKRTAVGRLQYYEKEEPSVVRRQVEDTERELSRYERALEQAEKELEALYERALGEAGADSAAVFMGHRMLLKDEEYRNSVTRAITGERVNAAFAVETVGDELCRLFLEILPRGIDKAQSLERLLEVSGLSREQMIACGDGYNDLSMIRYAGLGVAMENAVLPVRKAADHITASNNDDGVAMVVEQFLLT